MVPTLERARTDIHRATPGYEPCHPSSSPQRHRCRQDLRRCRSDPLLRANGEAIDAVKPIISGFDPARAGDSDCGVLLRALGLPLTDEEIEDISPWRFAAALSPDMAARHEGKEIDFDQLVSFCETAIEETEGDRC